MFDLTTFIILYAVILHKPTHNIGHKVSLDLHYNNKNI